MPARIVERKHGKIQVEESATFFSRAKNTTHIHALNLTQMFSRKRNLNVFYIYINQLKKCEMEI